MAQLPATNRPVLTGDALLQARVKAALDNVKLALQDFKDELQASTKLGDEVAAVRNDLKQVRGLWDQHALESSNELTAKLELTLTALLAPILKELGTASTSLSSSLASVSTSVTDGEARTVNLLQTHFSSLGAAHSGVTDAIRAVESQLQAESEKLQAAVGDRLERRFETLTKSLEEVHEGQQRVLDGLEAAKVDKTELREIRSMLERAEQERQQDRQTFTKELASLSSNLGPLVASLPQLTTLLRTHHDPSRTLSHASSTSLPPSAQPGQKQRAPSSNATQGGDSLGSNSGSRRPVGGGRSSSSESDSLRSNGHRSKTQSPPRVPRPSDAHASRKDLLPSSSAPGGGYSRSYTTPPEPVILEERQRSAFSPPLGPGTQALLHERSSSPANRAHAGEIFKTSFTAVTYVAATAADSGPSSAPSRMIGASAAARDGGNGTRRKRQKRQIFQSSDDELEDQKEEPEEKRRKGDEEEQEPDTQ